MCPTDASVSNLTDVRDVHLRDARVLRLQVLHLPVLRLRDARVLRPPVAARLRDVHRACAWLCGLRVP